MDSLPIVSQFQPFGIEHLTVIGATVFLSIALSIVLRRNTSPVRERVICIGLACLLIGIEWFNYVYVLMHEGGRVLVERSLPLHACGVALYLAAYTLIKRRQVMFEIVYFWAFAGTIQGVLTPFEMEGFPAWFCFHFFLTHGGVIVAVSALTFGLRMRPRWKGLWISYAAAWGLVVVVGILNWLLGTNYMFLCAPPSGPTPFYFLPWPWYMLFIGVLALALFILLWLPFARRKHS